MKFNEFYIDVKHLPELNDNKSISRELGTLKNLDFRERPLSAMVEEYEAKIIRDTLNRLNGNKTLTAKTLGLSVRNLYYKLEKYKLENNGMQ